MDKGRIPDGLQEMLKNFTEEMNNPVENNSL